MERVYVKSGVVKGDLSYKIYEIYDFPTFLKRCSKVQFKKIIPPSREFHSTHFIDSYIRDTNETFSEAAHETHNMR